MGWCRYIPAPHLPPFLHPVPRRPIRSSLSLPPRIPSSLRKFALQNFLPLAFATALIAALVWPDPGRALVELRVLDGVRIAQASKGRGHGGSRAHESDATEARARGPGYTDGDGGVGSRGHEGQGGARGCGAGVRGLVHGGGCTGAPVWGQLGGCSWAGDHYGPVSGE